MILGYAKMSWETKRTNYKGQTNKLDFIKSLLNYTLSNLEALASQKTLFSRWKGKPPTRRKYLQNMYWLRESLSSFPLFVCMGCDVNSAVVLNFVSLHNVCFPLITFEIFYFHFLFLAICLRYMLA